MIGPDVERQPGPPTAAAVADGYAGYEAWKGWTSYFQFDREEAEYFAGELRGIPLAGRSVLEIGFGTGSFLAWARAQGASVAGAEINDRSLTEAARAGVDLVDPAIERIANGNRGRFDVVVGFDVFEHFEADEVHRRIRAVETMLKPGGHVVLRFPNGQSPFGLVPQNGDVTHRIALSRQRMEQICQGTELRAVRYAGSYGVRGAWGPRRAVRCLRRAAQRAMGASLNLIYATRIPWDPVVVLVMQKPATGNGTANEASTS